MDEGSGSRKKGRSEGFREHARRRREGLAKSKKVKEGGRGDAKRSHEAERDERERRRKEPSTRKKSFTKVNTTIARKGPKDKVERKGVQGRKHEVNARQETRVMSKVGESVRTDAWPNDSAGDDNDAHYEYKREVREWLRERWRKGGRQRHGGLEAVGIAVRDEVNPTWGVQRGQERREYDEARNDDEMVERKRDGARRDEENKDEYELVAMAEIRREG
ncbi:hypothetical protein EDB84DRAFT_1679692 [Lactarius hengduanensis]|nr:hypothetical protein EDB84DRAFT_1679692 [Lactarius hengduanensis]